MYDRLVLIHREFERGKTIMACIFRKSLKLMSLKCMINTVNSAKRQETHAIILEK